jgi:hypothetical protein
MAKPSDAVAPLYNYYKNNGISAVGTIRWNNLLTPPVLEQLLYNHALGEEKWIAIPIYSGPGSVISPPPWPGLPPMPPVEDEEA